MPHPEVLVEMDLTTDTRWYTVKGKHYAFCGAANSLEAEVHGLKEDSPPDHPGWSRLSESETCYHLSKHLLVLAYPLASTPTEDRPGLCPESVDWEAHRAFLRSL